MTCSWRALRPLTKGTRTHSPGLLYRPIHSSPRSLSALQRPSQEELMPILGQSLGKRIVSVAAIAAQDILYDSINRPWVKVTRIDKT
jgi:hypothetical protein